MKSNSKMDSEKLCGRLAVVSVDSASAERVGEALLKEEIAIAKTKGLGLLQLTTDK